MPGSLPTLGTYQLQQELARGGMGIVYLAHDTGSGQTVAVKRMFESADPAARQRFLSEAETVRRLDHPNIVQLLHVDPGSADEPPYLVMPFLEGQDLERVLADRGRLTDGEVHSVLQQVAAALDHAHAHQVVHRDLKPANVMVTTSGQVVLTDFGIARALDQTGQSLTRTGMVIGTPEYMSPEQAAGHKVDRRADLYSLGVLAYRLLCGRPPFESDQWFAIVMAQAQQLPPDPCTFRPDLPRGMANTLLKMLRKDPASRYPNAAIFVSTLFSGTGEYEVSPTAEHPAAATVVTGPATPPPAGPPVYPALPPELAPRTNNALPIVVTLLGIGLILVAAALLVEKSRETPTRTTRTTAVRDTTPPATKDSSPEPQPDRPEPPSTKQPEPPATPIAPTKSTGASRPTGDFILPMSSDRRLTEADLRGLDVHQLRIARNEIFARHGYVFTKRYYQDYFGRKAWYRPNPSWRQDMRSAIEDYNIRFINKHGGGAD